MSRTTVTLDLPESLFDRLRELAEAADRPVESVLLESLQVMFDDLADMGLSVEGLRDLTDAQLWGVVHRRMRWTESLRLRELGSIQRQTPLTPDEQDEMDDLLAQVDQDMLLRSEALLLLKERGRDISHYLRRGA